MAGKPKYRIAVGHSSMAELVGKVEIEDTPPNHQWTMFSVNPNPVPVRNMLVRVPFLDITWVFHDLSEDEYATLLKVLWRVRLPFWRWN